MNLMKGEDPDASGWELVLITTIVGTIAAFFTFVFLITNGVI